MWAADFGNDGLGNGDTLTINFDTPTNLPVVATKADIDKLIDFNGRSLGNDYTGMWNGEQLVLTVVEASGGTIGPGYSIHIKPSGNLKSYDNTSLPLEVSRIIDGTFGGTSATPNVTSVVAADGGNNVGLGNGDTLTIHFDSPTNQPPAAMKWQIDNLISFNSRSLGTDYTGVWSDTQTLVVTVADANGPPLPPPTGPGYSIWINPGGNLRSFDNSSPQLEWSGTITGAFGGTSTTEVTTKATNYIVVSGNATHLTKADNTMVDDSTPITTAVDVQTFFSNINNASNATWKVFSAASEPTDATTFGTNTAKAYEDALAVGDVLAVLAQDGATLRIYAITVTAPPLYLSGTGTVDDPFIITTIEALNDVRNNPNAHFKLGANIDLDVTPYNTGEGWLPVGVFTGTFDGAGFNISNLFINKPASSNIGLFGQISSSSSISNLKLENISIKGASYTGGLVGIINGGFISNCSGTGIIYSSDSNYYTGGLIGFISNSGSIINSYAAVNISGNTSNKYDRGGLAGHNEGNISNCYALGSLSGTSKIGGLVGYNKGTLDNCYALGNASGQVSIGGLVGYNDGGIISNCYATGSVLELMVTSGGLVGSNNTGTINNSFYNKETTHKSDTGKGEPKTTIEMKYQSTYSGWDFSLIWSINENIDYPRLQNLYNQSPTTAVNQEYEFVHKWDSYGTGDGQFKWPKAVAVDSSQNVYVTDVENNRIQKFNSSGDFVGKWGSMGAENGQMSCPQGIAVDSGGNVYVADSNNNRIEKFSSTGAFLGTWGSSGTGDGQFNNPIGIAVDSSGNVYVADSNNNRIEKFSSTGAFLGTWGSSGTGNGQFNGPEGVAVDSSGYVYVADTYNNRIEKFSSTGEILDVWGVTGSEDGQFSSPAGVAIDSNGKIYVADFGNNRIQKFSATGEFSCKWGFCVGSGDGLFRGPVKVAVDSNGNVYVTDQNNRRMQKFGLITP